MSELMDNLGQPIQEVEEELPVQYFCKFTFAQFFTIMILGVFTLGFMFYLGARYGNDYLVLGQSESGLASSGPVIADGHTAVSNDPAKTEEMLQTAREALQQQQAEKLQTQVATMLQNPGAYPQAQPTVPAGALPPAQAVPPQVVYPQGQGQMPVQDRPLAVVPPQQMPQVQQLPPPTVPTTVSQTANSRVNDYEPQVAPPALPQPQSIPQNPTADDVPATPTTAAPLAAGSTFSVQVAASQNMNEANQWVQSWRDRGYSAFLMVADLPDKGRWYRVRLGSFPSRDTAENFASQLKVKEQIDAIAVQNE
jgi:cell division septation protein DedD